MGGWKVKVDEDLVQDVLKLRIEGKSYREIESELPISREAARVYCIERLPEVARDNIARRKQLEEKKRIREARIHSKTRKKPRPQHTSVRDYDFLQYIRIVYKTILKNYDDLTRGQLDLLLYLYPRGAFSYTEFRKFFRVVGLYDKAALKQYVKKGYIYVWRERKGNKIQLYALTNKAKTMCDDMHKYCVGEKEIPTSKSKNKLFTETGVRIDGYYGNIIKDINKRTKKHRDSINDN